MRGITWLLAALQILSGIVVLILVMLQKSKEDGFAGGGTVNNTSGMGMSKDNILSRWTAILGTVFVVLTIAVSTLMVIDLK